jgi:uncharacterized damage-inducible protein DinB
VKDEDRTLPAYVGDERELGLAFLAFHRDTLRWKLDGLTKKQLLQPHPPSTMTLLGLVRHLAVVEDSWFNEIFLGEELPEPWASVDWDADRDWEWHSAADYPVEESIALWETAIARSNAVIEAHGFDERSAKGSDRPSLRWIVMHMIEEYSRHNGHADLLREAIDGQTGA